MTILNLLGAALTGYLLGSIPTGVLMARLFGWPDPRTHGSGHTGATNVSRAAGLPALILVMTLDLLKGAGAVLLATTVFKEPWAVPLAGVAAAVGHNWPVWTGFKGGMGLAVSAGAVLTQMPLAVAITGAMWLLLRPLIRHSPRTTIASCVTVPLTLILLRAAPPIFALGTGAAAVIALRTLRDWNRVYEKKQPEGAA